MSVMGGTVMAGGMVGGLAFAGCGAAAVTLGCAVLLVVAARAAGRARARARARQGREGPPGCLLALAVLSVVLSLGFGLLGSFPGALASGVLAGVLCLRHAALARRAGRGPEIRPAWTDDDREWLESTGARLTQPQEWSR